MTPSEIIKGLQQKNIELTTKNDELIRLTEDAASKKRDYLIANAQKITVLKLAGSSITLIRDLVKGDKAVADLQYKWDIAEGVLMACRERIKDLRESIGTYRSILTWMRAELHNSE
jgi:hypothetical protein